MFIVRIVQNTDNTYGWGKWRILALEHAAPSIELSVRYQMLLQMIQSVCSECLKSLALTRGLLCKHLQTLQLHEKCFAEPAWLWPGRRTVYPPTHTHTHTVKPPNVSPQSVVLHCIFLLSIKIPVLTSLLPTGIRLPSKRYISLFTTASRPMLGPTPPQTQWVLRALPPGINGPRRT